MKLNSKSCYISGWFYIVTQKGLCFKRKGSLRTFTIHCSWADHSTFWGERGPCLKVQEPGVRGGVFPYILTINYGHVCTAVKGMVLQPFCPGGGGVLGSSFAGYVSLASQNPHPFIVYSVANNCKPHLSHFWANVIVISLLLSSQSSEKRRGQVTRPTSYIYIFTQVVGDESRIRLQFLFFSVEIKQSKLALN